MKHVKVLALGIILSVSQMTYPYAIVNDASSVSDAVVYIFKDEDKYLKILKARGVPDEVLKYADKVALAAPAIGAALAVPTEGTSLLVAEAVPISVAAAKAIIKALQDTGLMDKAIQGAAGVVAVHKNVVPGNKGRNAEWSWKDIEKEYGISQGGRMYVVITDKAHGVPLLQTTLASNGLMGFTIKKDTQGKLFAEQSSSAASEYVPSSTSSQERTWLDKLKGTIKEAYEELTK